MLVLSRKRGESLRIGDAVVHVLRIDRGTVRLGIDAPREVAISRPDQGGVIHGSSGPLEESRARREIAPRLPAPSARPGAPARQ